MTAVCSFVVLFDKSNSKVKFSTKNCLTMAHTGPQPEAQDLKMQRVRDLYTDPLFSAAGTGLATFYSALKKQKLDENLSKEDVKRALMQESAYVMHLPRHNRFPRRQIDYSALGQGLSLQADLCVMPAGDDPPHPEYIFVLVDIFTLYIYAKAIVHRSKDEVRRAFDELVAENKKQLSRVQDLGSDAGPELMSNARYWKNKYNILHFPRRGTQKANLSEWACRALKKRIYFLLTTMNKDFGYWPRLLPYVVSSMNATYVRAIGAAPEDINDKSFDNLVRDRREKTKRKPPKYRLIEEVYRVGDYVWYEIKKDSMIYKGFRKQRQHIGIVSAVNNFEKPYLYHLTDIKGHPLVGSWYAFELRKAEHPQKLRFKIEAVLGKRVSKDGALQYKLKFHNWPNRCLHLALKISAYYMIF
jgi:hypothetical protein